MYMVTALHEQIKPYSLLAGVETTQVVATSTPDLHCVTCWKGQLHVAPIFMDTQDARGGQKVFGFCIY